MKPFNIWTRCPKCSEEFEIGKSGSYDLAVKQISSLEAKVKEAAMALNRIANGKHLKNPGKVTGSRVAQAKVYCKWGECSCHKLIARQAIERMRKEG